MGKWRGPSNLPHVFFFFFFFFFFSGVICCAKKRFLRKYLVRDFLFVVGFLGDFLLVVSLIMFFFFC